jgi:hypothetical protein
MPRLIHTLLAISLSAFVVAPSARAEGAEGERRPRMVEPGIESGLTEITVAARTPWMWVIDNIGTGVALLDYDLDGDLDVFQVQASALEGFPGQPAPTNHLYRNEGGGRFTQVTAASGVGQAGWGQGVVTGDYDNDGDPDLFVTSFGPDRLYRNEGDGTFREVAGEAGVADGGWATGAAFVDVDNDGLLDLYVARYVIFDHTKIPPKNDPDTPCTYKGIAVVCGPMSLPQARDILYRNNGDGTFADVTEERGIAASPPRFGLGVVTGDVEGDGDQDIFVGNDSEPNYLLINDGKGHFTEEGLLMGVAYAGDGRGQASMGVTFGDPDGDGDLDLYISHFASDYSTLYENDGTGFFEDQSLKAGLVQPTIIVLSWGTKFIDFDNDGDEDLFSSNGHVYPEATQALMGSDFRQRCQIFLNDGLAHFTELPVEEAGPALSHEAAHRGAAFGDIDGDGDIDAVVTRMFESLGFYRNDLPAGNHWTSIMLHGRAGNRDAVGARVTVHAGARRWLRERHGGGSFESASDPRLHVGLGAVDKIDRIEVRWPSGLVQSLGPFQADATITLVEPENRLPEGGSPQTGR